MLRNPYKIGGVDVIVQVDESVMSKRKYHVGRMVKEVWVFGGIDQHGKAFLVTVEDRTMPTLERLIKKHIHPGSIIHSDSFRSYNGITAIDVEPRYKVIRLFFSYSSVQINESKV